MCIWCWIVKCFICITFITVNGSYWSLALCCIKNNFESLWYSCADHYFTCKNDVIIIVVVLGILLHYRMSILDPVPFFEKFQTPIFWEITHSTLFYVSSFWNALLQNGWIWQVSNLRSNLLSSLKVCTFAYFGLKM